MIMLPGETTLNTKHTVTRAYKNESGVIFLGDFYFNATTSFKNTNYAVTSPWRVAKFNNHLAFSTTLLPMQAYFNDVFVKIFSPLHLTFSYDLNYSITGASNLSSTLRIGLPVYYFLVALIPLTLVMSKRKLKKVKV